MRKGSMKWNGEEEENPPIHIKKQTLSSSPHKWKAEKPPRHAYSLSKQNTPIRSTLNHITSPLSLHGPYGKLNVTHLHPFRKRYRPTPTNPTCYSLCYIRKSGKFFSAFTAFRPLSSSSHFEEFICLVVVPQKTL